MFRSLLFLIVIVVSLCLKTQVSAQNKMLIADRGHHSIFAYTLSDSTLQELETFTVQNTFDAYDLEGVYNSGQLYWSNGISHNIVKGQATDPAGITVLSNALADTAIIVDIALDSINGTLYLLDAQSKTIIRTALDGSSPTIIPTPRLSNPTALAVCPSLNMLYYADMDSNKIWRSTMDGQDVKVLVEESIDFPARLAVAASIGKLYWTDDGLHTVSRINLDGTNQEVLYWGSDEEHPFGLFVHEPQGYVYWTDYSKSSVMRCNLDGTNVTPVVTIGLKRPVALSFMYAVEERSSDAITQVPPSVMAYPNPTTSTINIVSGNPKQDMKWIKIYNKQGSLMLARNVESPTFQTDVSMFQDGYYNYVVFIADQLISGHFSIAH